MLASCIAGRFVSTSTTIAEVFIAKLWNCTETSLGRPNSDGSEICPGPHFEELHLGGPFVKQL